MRTRRIFGGGIFGASVLGASVLGAGLALLLALPVAAQDSATLADMRAELAAVRQGVQALRAELVASGGQGFQAAGGDSAIDRMNVMEAQIARLTDRLEQSQNRINRIVEDGTRRIGDLEFRLCDADPTCDLGALATPELGNLAIGGGAVAVQVAPPDAPGDDHAMATTAAEQADFDQARQVMGQGDFSRAAELFAQVARNHAGGPLTPEALYMRGAALDSAGEPRAAAAAWLEGFAADPDGPRAGENLLGIARVITEEGDAMAACLYLAEIPARFPGSDHAAEADQRMAALQCGSSQLDLGAAGATLDGLALPPEADANMDPEAIADMAEHF